MAIAAEHIHHVSEISRHLAEIGTDFTGVLHRLTREVAERLGDAALLELIGPDGTALVPTSLHHPEPAARELATSLAGAAASRVGVGLTGGVAASGRPVLLPTVDPELLRNLLSEDVRAYVDRYPVHSVLSVPLRTHEGAIGVLTAWRDSSPDAYGERDLELLQAIADHAALAIVNARLFDSLQRTHQTLTQRTYALEQALAELETFAWSVSHDLRAPLHTIQGFAGALREDYGDALDPVGVQFIERIQCSAEHMNELLEDLLELARLSQLEPAREAVDVSALAWTVVGEMRSRHPEQRVEVRIAPDLQAEGDPQMLLSVLGNLLANAWKFTGTREAAEVVVEGERTPDGLTLVVRDNGVGFDMAQADRLFTPFQRLHNRADFPGTGIGLAIVDRIARKHGGRVTGRGEPGRGAEFRVFLPVRG